MLVLTRKSDESINLGLSIALFERMSLDQLFANDNYKIQITSTDNQLKLFD